MRLKHAPSAGGMYIHLHTIRRVAARIREGLLRGPGKALVEGRNDQITALSDTKVRTLDRALYRYC